MKEMELKNLKPLKKTITRLLISISIFSLVFSWSSLCSSSNLLYYHTLHYFSTHSFHLKNIAMNKNSLFLICNGILVFLAKTSPFVCPPSASDLDDSMLHKRVEREVETLPDKHIILLDEDDNEDEDEDEDDQETKTYEAEEIEAIEEEDDQETKTYEAEEIEAIEEEEEEMKVDREFELSNERGDEVSLSAENDLQISWPFDNADDRDQEEEVDEIEKLSDEELNKKCEDFIRKMKEEFKINEYQQQQLVVVK